MRPVNRGQQPDGLVIRKYRDALPVLSERLGRYCSYCEARLPLSLAIEHIMPKSKHPELELVWENFLLACHICNSIKGTNDIKVSDFFLPDKDNTFTIFEYFQAGIIINDSLNSQDREKAERTLQLVGLNRLNGEDNRFIDFVETWNLVLRYKEKWYKNPSTDIIESIVDLAKESGHFSIWMTVFADNPDIKKRLINAFPGTEKKWFDEEGRPKPLQ
ncbi:MAG: HNH endonuclease [Planctomycetaceae bacterium]|nr:HNH endonuclease [Planctomycetaceae bacterium]